MMKPSCAHDKTLAETRVENVDSSQAKTPTETSPHNAATLEETLLLPPRVLEALTPEIDSSAVVDAAEEILREGAPHDFDVLVIGGGPGGYVAAIRAAQLGAHVGLIEERELGGVCLNRGCIPTKTLLESVDVMRLLRRAKEYGLTTSSDITPNMARMNERKREVIEHLRGHVAHLLEENDVEVLQGRARFVDSHKVEYSMSGGETKTVSAIHIIIASGSLPSKLPVEGADLDGVITSDEMLANEFEPQDVVVIGAGAVGVEFAYLFHQLGAKSVLLERTSVVMPGEDADIGREMSGILARLGIEIVCDAQLQRIEKDGDNLVVIYQKDGA